MKVFGLTGGIGMGKSTAGHLLQERGVSVIDTDDLARRIVEPGQPALEEIKLAFGNEVIAADGRLRRQELAAIIFPDPQARQKLESITHPRIKELWKARIKTWRDEECPVAVVVIPLLFETGEKELDSVICVGCTRATQLQRLQERRWTPEQTSLRLAAQWPLERKIASADFVVWSEGGLEVLAEQLNRIIRSQ